MMFDHSTRAILLIALLGSAVSNAWCAPRIDDALERKVERPLEDVPGVTSIYGSFETSDGYRLRTILTLPEDIEAPLPAVQFIQWLSCDSIEIRGTDDGWTRMMRGLVQGGSYAVLRVDKAGVGDSEGPACSALDYETELRHHREALDHLRTHAEIDADRIAIFGASMGATMAPLVAAGKDLAGVAVWGGGARTWFERLVAFDRHALELGGAPPAEINPEMELRIAFHHAYLVKGETPEKIAAKNPQLAPVWSRIKGTDGDLHYGRPISFHQQAQRQNWPAAWARVGALVLVLYGEYDWYETEASHRLISTAVNADSPALAELHVIPRMDHHFMVYPDARAAFRETGGHPDPSQVVELLTAWLNRVLDLSTTPAASNPSDPDETP